MENSETQSVDINSIAILSVHNIDYHCIINGITKSEAINSLKNYDLNENRISL